MIITIDARSWNVGWYAGFDGVSLRQFPNCPPNVLCRATGELHDGYSFSSGFIEGKAAREGYKAPKPTMTREQVAARDLAVAS